MHGEKISYKIGGVFMKKAGLIFVSIALLAVMGCTTTDFTNNDVGTFNLAPIATKDYEVLGPVSLTAEDVLTVGFAGWTQSHSGSTVTFENLLTEAKKLGADDIINVRIDIYDNNSTNKILDPIIGYTKTYRYIGNALAIKYTTAINGAAAENWTNRLGGSLINENTTETKSGLGGILDFFGF
jgi:hypothetical protein